MQLWHSLIRAAIRDEPITHLIEFEFSDKAFDRLKEIGQKRCVGGGERHQIWQGLLGHEQNVNWITRFGMIKREQGVGLAQAPNRDEKT